jgi:hypothetical protein
MSVVSNKKIPNVYLYFIGSIFFFTLITIFSAFAQNNIQNSNIKKSFFNTLRTVSRNPESKKTIKAFTENHPGLLNAFLNDLIETASAFENQEFLNPSLKPAQDFSAKWSVAYQGDPQAMIFFPILERLLQDFSVSMKQKNTAGGPLSNLYQFFQLMSKKNMGGFEKLFQFSWPDPKTRRLHVYERKTITGYGKEEDIFIHERQVIQTVNSFATFVEFIFNDQFVYVMVTFPEISILHQALIEIERDGEDLDAFLLVKYYCDLISQELELAWNRGELNHFFKDFLTNPDFHAKNVAFSKHPLFKPPYRPDEFSVLPYYYQ